MTLLETAIVCNLSITAITYIQTGVNNLRMRKIKRPGTKKDKLLYACWKARAEGIEEGKDKDTLDKTEAVIINAYNRDSRNLYLLGFLMRLIPIYNIFLIWDGLDGVEQAKSIDEELIKNIEEIRKYRTVVEIEDK